MVKKYVAEIDLSVNGKKYTAGQEIKEKLSEVDKRFLLEEGYIKSSEEAVKEQKAAGPESKKGPGNS